MEPAPDYPAAAAITSRASQQLALPPGKAGSGDNFAIDDLLDFSNEDEDGSLGDHLGGWSSPLDAASGNSTDSSTATTTVTHDNHENNNTSAVGSGAGGGLDCTSGGDQYVGDNAIADLCVPYEDLADLEWLSHLEEEPFSTEDIQKLQLISGSGALKSAVASSSDAHSELSTNTTGSVTTAGAGSTSAKPLRPPMAEADEAPMLPPLFLPEAPVRGARSKRSRAAAPGNWTSRLLLLTSSAARASSPESELLLVPSSHTHLEQYSPPLKKAQKPAKKKESHANHEGLGGLAALTGLAPSPDGRKCLHCQTDKTPQWRTGPMGPKTLCNACGVRYKSGRLVPEYRPAASPTFIQSKHSNSHRKVMELRRQKEMIHHQHLIHQQPLPQHQHHQHHQQNNYYEHRLHGGTSPYLPHPNGFYDGDDFVIHRHVGPDFRQLI